MPGRAPVGKIRRPYFEEEEAPYVPWWDSITVITPDAAIPPDSSTTIQIGNIWDYDPNIYRLVHTSAVIRVLPKINTHFVTNIPTSKGDVTITVSPTINGSVCLVIMNDHVILTCYTYLEIFRLYSYSQQQYMLHPNEVGVFRLIYR